MNFVIGLAALGIGILGLGSSVVTVIFLWFMPSMKPEAPLPIKSKAPLSRVRALCARLSRDHLSTVSQHSAPPANVSQTAVAPDSVPPMEADDNFDEEAFERHIQNTRRISFQLTLPPLPRRKKYMRRNSAQSTKGEEMTSASSSRRTSATIDSECTSGSSEGADWPCDAATSELAEKFSSMQSAARPALGQVRKSMKQVVKHARRWSTASVNPSNYPSTSASVNEPVSTEFGQLRRASTPPAQATLMAVSEKLSQFQSLSKTTTRASTVRNPAPDRHAVAHQAAMSQAQDARTSQPISPTRPTDYSVEEALNEAKWVPPHSAPTQARNRLSIALRRRARSRPSTAERTQPYGPPYNAAMPIPPVPAVPVPADATDPQSSALPAATALLPHFDLPEDKHSNEVLPRSPTPEDRTNDGPLKKFEDHLNAALPSPDPETPPEEPITIPLDARFSPQKSKLKLRLFKQRGKEASGTS